MEAGEVEVSPVLELEHLLLGHEHLHHQGPAPHLHEPVHVDLAVAPRTSALGAWVVTTSMTIADISLSAGPGSGRNKRHVSSIFTGELCS